jgi:outer membrane protein
MRSRSLPVGASTAARAVYPLFALILCVGCSWADFTGPPPLPAEVSPDAVRARMIAPATLDTVGPAARPAPTGSSSSAPVPPASAEPTEVFALPQAVDFGVQNNPRLAAALAAIEAARGQVDVAFSAFVPEIDFLTHEGITNPNLGPAAAGPTGIILPSATATHAFAQAELQLQWTIYDFGRTGGKYHQAQARERIAALQSVRARQTVGFDVATAYLMALRAAATRRIQEEAIRRAEATLRDTRSRRAAGVSEKDDVLRAEVHLVAAEEDVDLARQSELNAIARLNNAMGRNASLPLTLIPWKFEPPLNLSLVQCLEIAAEQRAEIGIAREAVAAAQFGRESAQGEFLPRVYTLGSTGVVDGSSILSGLQAGAGLHIDVPLYTGGRREGTLIAADAEIRRAIADARSVLDEVTLQVTLAYVAATTARRRIERDYPAIVEANENLRLVRNRYRNGHATPTDIVDAEVALTGSQQRLISANYEYLGALVGLDYALENPPASLLGPAEAPKAENAQPPDGVPAPPPLPKPE